MTDFPTVTVLLPVFFRHVSAESTHLLRRALESVADQNYEGGLSVLLIDDGSPTPVKALANSLGSVARIVDWRRLPRNQGIVRALNAGLAAAESPLVARLDADDTWLDGKLRAQVCQFMGDQNLTISATGMIRIDSSGSKVDEHIRPSDWSGIFEFFVNGGCPFPHGSVVASRKIFQLLGGYPYSAAVRHCEDYALWGTWLRFFKPSMIERVMYSYRVKNSVSAEFGSQQTEASRRVRQKFEDLDLARTLPENLSKLAEILGITMLEAGLLTYRVWNFRVPLAIPFEAAEHIAAILPDRVLTQVARAPHWRTILDGTDRPVDGLLLLQADSVF